MVTNPYSRHPAVTAAVAALDELSGGWAFLGLGVGAGLEEAGIGYPAPVTTLREAVSVIRALPDGETVTHDGKALSLREAALRVPPPGRVGP